MDSAAAAGTVFTGVLRFHNLRPIELGALLASISFDNHPNCRHNIGMGKPMGYGKVKMMAQVTELDACNGQLTTETDFIKQHFDAAMMDFDPQWRASSSLRELFAMASFDIPLDRQEDFTYMQMSVGGKNEFVDGKKAYAQDGQQLGLFSQIVDGNVPTATFVGNVKATDEKQRRVAHARRRKQEEQSQAKFEQRAKDLSQLQGLKGQETIDRLEELLKKYPGDDDIKRMLDQWMQRKEQVAQLMLKAWS